MIACASKLNAVLDLLETLGYEHRSNGPHRDLRDLTWKDTRWDTFATLYDRLTTLKRDAKDWSDGSEIVKRLSEAFVAVRGEVVSAENALLGKGEFRS